MILNALFVVIIYSALMEGHSGGISPEGLGEESIWLSGPDLFQHSFL